MAAKKRQVLLPDQTVHHESLRKKRRTAGSAGMSLNLTPMIDVTFQLLIFFVVATNFIREGIISSKLPEVNPSGTPPPVPPITITVDELGDGSVRVYVNNLEGRGRLEGPEKAPVALVEVNAGGAWMPLAEYLKMLQGQTGYARDTTAVFIRPTARPSWQFVLAVYNSVIAAGYKEIGWSSGTVQPGTSG